MVDINKVLTKSNLVKFLIKYLSVLQLKSVLGHIQ